MIYGFSGQAALPFGPSTLCVAGSLRRTPLLQSGGSPLGFNDCSGSVAIDMNAFASGWAGGNPHPGLLQIGQGVNAQFLGRKAGGLYLTNGLEFVVGP